MDVVALGLAKADAAKRYRKVFAVAAPTGTATTDTAAITAAATAASAAGGGMVVLQGGQYELNAPLPVRSGVGYQGVEPLLASQDNTTGVWLADGEWNYSGGTVLHGDGTFACFEANATDQGSTGTTLGATALRNVSFDGLGLDNFTYGLHIGASNIMGLTWSRIGRLWIKNCSQWGVQLINFAHCHINMIATSLCQNGQFYGTKILATTFIPGNTFINEVYNLNPRDGRDNRLCRGIVFESIANGALNEIDAARIQNNGYNRALLSVTATFTSGSTAIAVPDATKFAPHMAVTFTTTANGVTSGQAYIVQSVNTGANTITIGNSFTAAALSATGSGTATVQTYGMANIEATGMRASRIQQVDSEGTASVGLYIENSLMMDVVVSEGPATFLVGVVARNWTFSRVFGMPALSVDWDSSSTARFDGTISALIQRRPYGQQIDTQAGTTVWELTGGTSPVWPGGSIHSRSNFLYPNRGMGERIYWRTTGFSAGGADLGDIVFTGTAAATMTLPTIVVDSSTALGNSNVGLWYDFINLGTAAMTLTTQSSQLFNKVAGLTSITVAVGDSVRVVAMKDAASNLFWMAKRITLLSS